MWKGTINILDFSSHKESGKPIFQRFGTYGITTRRKNELVLSCREQFQKTARELRLPVHVATP
jgi:hypothetical protein